MDSIKGNRELDIYLQNNGLKPYFVLTYENTSQIGLTRTRGK